MKKARPEALFAPSSKPRAVLSARYPSKGAARPQLRNFGEQPKGEVRRIHLMRLYEKGASGGNSLL
jgi:hypothetical protein